MKAICVGHSTYDTTLPMDEYPTENLKYRIKNHIECGGGPASNGAYLLAKWGIDTTILSVVGDDYYGEKIIEDFKKIGVNTNFIEKKENHLTSSSYIIANMSNGSRTIITSKSSPIRKLQQTVKINDANLILIDGEHPETALEILEANKNAISVLDAGRLTDDTKKLGQLVTYLVCSKTFAEDFSQIKISTDNIETLTAAYNSLVEYFKTNVIITLEEKGSFTMLDNLGIVPSIKVKAIDSTGAGDIFHGAFTYFIGNGYSLQDTIKYSSITGGISVTRVGSRNSIPEIDEVLNYDNVI